MRVEDFNRLFLGEWSAISERQIAIYDRLVLYYESTSGVDNKAAYQQWDLFRQWCDDRGYSREDIRQAKRDAQSASKSSQ